jgi:hypothetical protein
MAGTSLSAGKLMRDSLHSMQFILVKEILHTFSSFFGGHSLVVQLNLNYMVILLLIQLLHLANLSNATDNTLAVLTYIMSVRVFSFMLYQLVLILNHLILHMLLLILSQISHLLLLPLCLMLHKILLICFTIMLHKLLFIYQQLITSQLLFVLTTSLLHAAPQLKAPLKQQFAPTAPSQHVQLPQYHSLA